MKKFLKELVKSLTLNVAWELFKASIFLALGFVLTIQIPNFPISTYIFAALMLVGLLLLFLFDKDDFKYVIKDKDIHFEPLDGYCQYKLIQSIIVKAKDIEYVYWKYWWHKDRNVDIELSSTDYSLVPLSSGTSQYNRYHINLGRKYYKREKVDLAINAKLDGPPLFPCFATTILSPVRHLHINIKLSLKKVEKDIELCRSTVPEEIGIPKTTRAVLNVNGEYRWNIKNPKIGYEYAIIWKEKI